MAPDRLKLPEDDPILQVLRSIRRDVARLAWATVLLFVLLLLTGAAALYLRSQALEHNFREVQRSRAEITYTNCLQVNDRHDRTIDQLDRILGERKMKIREQIRQADPAEQEILRAQIDALDASRNSTVSLIDALAPHTSCEQQVIDRFGYVPDLEEES